MSPIYPSSSVGICPRTKLIWNGSTTKRSWGKAGRFHRACHHQKMPFGSARRIGWSAILRVIDFTENKTCSIYIYIGAMKQPGSLSSRGSCRYSSATLCLPTSPAWKRPRMCWRATSQWMFLSLMARLLNWSYCKSLSQVAGYLENYDGNTMV